MSQQKPKIIHSIRRHEQREADKDGKKLVDITNEGFNRATYYGSLINKNKHPEKKIIGYHSIAPRAKQTLQGILIGAGFKNPTASMIQTNQLNEIDFSLNPDYHAELKSLKEYDDRINFLLQCPDKSGKSETMEQAGDRAALHLYNTTNMYNKSGSGIIYVEHLTHGPVIEAALIRLIDPDIKDIKSLHGGFREGENFRVINPLYPVSEVHFRGEHATVLSFNEYSEMIG